MKRNWLVLLLFAAVVSAATPSHADAQKPPVLQLGVTGTCPSQEQVKGSLRQANLATTSKQESAAHWELTVERHDDKAIMRLFDANHHQVLQREVASEECEAIATAFALITQTHFISLGYLPQPVSDPPVAVQDARAFQRLAPNLRPEPARAAVTVPTPPPTVSKEAAPLNLAFGAGVAGEASLPAAPASIAAIARVAIYPSQLPVFARLQLSVQTPVVLNQFPNRVSRWTNQLAVSAGLPSDGPTLRWKPAVGVGAQLHRIRALDLAGSETLFRVTPALIATLDLVYNTGTRFSPWIQLRAYMTPMQDQYRIQPEGEVARSPVFGASLSIGLDIYTSANPD